MDDQTNRNEGPSDEELLAIQSPEKIGSADYARWNTLKRESYRRLVSQPLIGTRPASQWTKVSDALPPERHVVEYHCPSARTLLRQTGLGYWYWHPFDKRVVWYDDLRDDRVEYPVTHWIEKTEVELPPPLDYDPEEEKAKRPIGLLSCCGPKSSHAAPAKDLYRSDLFRLSRRYVEQRCDEWAILSAKYGLVLPDKVIEPYDVCLRDHGVWNRRSWASGVGVQIKKQWPRHAHRSFVVLAGADYVAATAGLNVNDPLQGMGIGRRLNFLKLRVTTE